MGLARFGGEEAGLGLRGWAGSGTAAQQRGGAGAGPRAGRGPCQVEAGARHLPQQEVERGHGRGASGDPWRWRAARGRGSTGTTDLEWWRPDRAPGTHSRRGRGLGAMVAALTKEESRGVRERKRDGEERKRRRRRDLGSRRPATSMLGIGLRQRGDGAAGVDSLDPGRDRGGCGRPGARGRWAPRAPLGPGSAAEGGRRPGATWRLPGGGGWRLRRCWPHRRRQVAR